MPAESYSQFQEDRLVLDYFSGKPDGFFIEVGAFDPEELSSTFLLEQKGWKGILIEPQPACCVRLREKRKAEVIEAACGAPGQRGEADFYVAGPYSGFTTEANPEQISQKVRVKVETLDNILAERGNPRIDFASIDVEGFELTVLRGFTLEKHRPSLILIEDHVSTLEVHNHITAHGFKLVKRTGCNNWYVPREVKFQNSLIERWKLFRFMQLGTPFRRWRRERRKRQGKS
jgi:FkbM family methyltransferase